MTEGWAARQTGFLPQKITETLMSYLPANESAAKRSPAFEDSCDFLWQENRLAGGPTLCRTDLLTAFFDPTPVYSSY